MGEQDNVSPLKPWKEVMDINPQLVLKVIENSGHSPMMEQPKEFWEAIETFLEESHIYKI